MKKECVLCDVKIDEDFVKNFKPKEYSSMHGFCRLCRKKLRALQLKLGGKVCTKCSLDKPFGDYPYHKKTYDGFDSWCKQCRREYRYELHQSLDTHIRVILNRSNEDKRKIRCDLTLEELVNLFNSQNGKCAISGVEMAYQRTKRVHNMYNASLDRIDSAGDYTLSNVQFVCWFVNRMKGETSTEELIKWCNFVIENNKQK